MYLNEKNDLEYPCVCSDLPVHSTGAAWFIETTWSSVSLLWDTQDFALISGLGGRCTYIPSGLSSIPYKARQTMAKKCDSA